MTPAYNLCSMTLAYILQSPFSNCFPVLIAEAHANLTVDMSVCQFIPEVSLS